MPTEHNLKTRQKRDAKIFKEYETGKSARMLRKKYGLSHQGIINVIRKMGASVHPRGGTKLLSLDDAKQIRFLYEKGVSYKKLMNKYNVCYSTIYNAIRRAGGTVSSTVFTDEQAQQLKQLYEEGISSYRMTQTCGYSNATLRRTIRRVGGEIRPNGRPRKLVNEKEERKVSNEKSDRCK